MSRDTSKFEGSKVTYLTGFGLSILLTVAAYVVVVRGSFGHTTAIALIIGLALSQFLVQVVFFLHLGDGSKQRWNYILLLFMLVVVGTIVIGSIWIMANLNYSHEHTHTLLPSDTTIINDEGLQH